MRVLSQRRINFTVAEESMCFHGLYPKTCESLQESKA